MQLLRNGTLNRSLAGLCLGSAFLLAGVGCGAEDVGAPCNHGQVEPPESKLVTFPALSCNDLLCVYADEDEPPGGGCTNDSDCNKGGDLSVQKFSCNTVKGECVLRVDYVLERSMCSKKCSDDGDCKNSGTNKVVVDGTECQTGFSCARIQSLGQFCCEKLCVCNDDLGPTSELDMLCSTSNQEGCCVENGVPKDPMPEACGKP